MLTNIGVIMYGGQATNFSSTATVLDTYVVQSQGLLYYGQTPLFVLKLSSSAYTTAGLAIKFNIYFDSSIATSGMGACVNGTINASTNVTVTQPAQSQIAMFSEVN